MFERLRDGLPSLPTLTREVDIPVYLIHTDAGADDYFFIFDFEGFAEQSKQGWFVRPKLKLWAGRDDFSRTRFAEYFRQTFQAEFERMRAANAPESTDRGWLTFHLPRTSDFEIGGLIVVAQVVLWVALLGPAILRNFFKIGFFGRKRRAETEKKIESLSAQVDGVLREIDVHLHPELYERARTFHGPVQRSRVVRDAWPLPTYVREHLDDQKNGAWW